MKSSSCQVDASGAGGGRGGIPTREKHRVRMFASTSAPLHSQLFFPPLSPLSQQHTSRQRDGRANSSPSRQTRQKFPLNFTSRPFPLKDPACTVPRPLTQQHDTAAFLTEPRMTTCEPLVRSRYRSQVHKVGDRSTAATPQLPVRRPSNFDKRKEQQIKHRGQSD